MTCSPFVERTRCPACEAAASRQLYDCGLAEPPVGDYLRRYYAPYGGVEPEYLDDARYSLLECNGCGLIYQKHVPGDELMHRLYEKWMDPDPVFRAQLETCDLDYYAGYAQEIMQLIAMFRRPPAELKFLDFGMGWGRWARMAGAFGCDSWGLERSPSRVDYATSNGVQVLGPEDLDEHRFDLINTEQVLEHVTEPLETLRRLRRCLQPGGIIKVSVPDGRRVKRNLADPDWSAPKGAARSLNPVAPLEHLNCFNRRALLSTGRAAGLDPVRIPMLTQYRYTTGWRGTGGIIRKLLQPVYRNVLRRGTYVLLTPTAAS